MAVCSKKGLVTLGLQMCSPSLFARFREVLALFDSIQIRIMEESGWMSSMGTFPTNQHIFFFFKHHRMEAYFPEGNSG